MAATAVMCLHLVVGVLAWRLVTTPAPVPLVQALDVAFLPPQSQPVVPPLDPPSPRSEPQPNVAAPSVTAPHPVVSSAAGTRLAAAVPATAVQTDAQPQTQPQQAAVAVSPHAEASPSATQARPVEVSAPKLVSASAVRYARAPAPLFPAQSRRLGEEGEVVLKVLVDVEGRPAQVLVVRSSGYARLDDAAVQAMKAALFKPYVEDGRALSVWVQTPVAFQLEQSS